MIISFILLLLLPFLVISSSMVHQFRTIMIKKAYIQSRENMVRSKSRTISTLNRALNISDKISVMNDIGNIISKEYKDILDVFLTYYDFTTFKDFINDYEEITAVKLYAENKTLFNNWEIIPVDMETKEKAWYKRAVLTKGLNSWLNFDDVTKNPHSKLSLVRFIHFREGIVDGVLVIDIDTTRLNSIFAKESYETFIVDDKGTIIATNCISKEDINYSDLEGGYPKLRNAHGAYELRIKEKRYHLLVDDIVLDNSTNKLKIFSLFSVSSIIEEANQVWWLGLRTISLIFIIATIALYFIYSILVHRLIKVQENMDIVASGHFHSFLDIDGRDEIGKLAVHFNNMVKNINALVNQIDVTNEQKRILESHQNEIKLQMLASQINPHFLFNSLEAIRMKAHIDKQPEIANVVKQLGRLMRKIIDVKGSLTPLGNELEIIKNFLGVEKFRLDSNLTYNIDIDDECLDILIPPLLIQPLVENALIHGIEQKIGGGHLNIKAKIVGEEMHVSVEDDGPGISEKKRMRLLSGSGEDEGSHIGIRNVHERLKLTYGDKSGIRIEESDKGGVLIQFSIPRGSSDV